MKKRLLALLLAFAMLQAFAPAALLAGEPADGSALPESPPASQQGDGVAAPPATGQPEASAGSSSQPAEAPAESVSPPQSVAPPPQSTAPLPGGQPGAEAPPPPPLREGAALPSSAQAVAAPGEEGAAQPEDAAMPDFSPLGPPRQKEEAGMLAPQAVPASPQYFLGGQPGDYLYLIYDRGDTGAQFQNQATLEVFKDDSAGAGSWQTQYYANNSSGVSLYYSIGGVPRHYVTPYFSTWAASAGTKLKDSDAVVTKPDANTISVRWIQPEFTFEMRYIYRSGSLSFQREYYLTNTSGAQMTDVKLVYGGDTYFGGNDYGYSYWNPSLSMVYIRSSSGSTNFMGLSSAGASAYFGGAYNSGAVNADKAALPNSVTLANTDQSYYLQWNRQYVNSGETYTQTATERYSVGGALQIISPQNQVLVQPAAATQVTYSFLVVNTDVQAAPYDFTASSSRGYPVSVSPGSISVDANGQKQVDVTVTIPAGAPLGDDKITFTGTNSSTGSKGVAYAITTMVTPPDTTPPVIGSLQYAANTTWVKGSETVSFTVTDNVAVDQGFVRVKNPAGASVSVTKGTGDSYSFQATVSGIYTIDAKDSAGNSATTVYTRQINVDNSPPTVGDIRIAPKGTTAYTSILSTPVYSYFTNAASEITLTLNDSASGVKTLAYQFVQKGGAINNANWTTQPTFASPLQTRDVVISALPNYASSPATPFVGCIAVQLTDAVGNVSTTTVDQNGRYVSENQAPATGITVQTSGFDPAKWYDSVLFRVVATDPNSGLQRVEVLNGGTTNYTYTPAAQANGLGGSTALFDYTATAPGIYNVSTRATDKSGNTGLSVPQQVKICNQTPVLVLSPEPPTGWTNANVVLNLGISNSPANASSPVYSPVTYSYQKKGDTSWQTIGTAEPGASVVLTLSASMNDVYVFRAVTATGKTSAMVERTIRIDKTLPAAAALHTQAGTPGTPQDTPDGENGWYKTIPLLSITPPPAETSPSESPVKTLYRFADEANFATATPTEYTGQSPVIPAPGKYAIEVYTQDAAGNQSAHQTRYINVDRDAPFIGGISLRAMNLSDVTGISGLFQLFNGNVVASATVTDDLSGIYNVYYQAVAEGSSFNPAGPFTQCAKGADGSYSLTVTPQFRGSLYFATKDNAGNGSYRASGMLVADTAPPTAPTLDAGGYVPGSWAKDPVTVQAAGSTALSGIEGYYYKVKGTAELLAMPSGGLPAATNAETSYQFFAKSKLGMLSAPAEMTVRCDTEAPALTAVPASTAPTNQELQVDMTASAGVSGITEITVSLDGGTPVNILPRFTGGTGLVRLPNNGSYLFTVVNGAGVRSTTTLKLDNIDKEAPAEPAYTVAPDLPNPQGNNPWRTEAQTITVTPPPADGGSAISVYYQLYQTGTTPPAGGSPYTGPLPVTADGDYTFELWAQDEAGNLSGRQQRQLVLDLTAPTLDITLGGISPFTNSASIQFTASDSGPAASGPWYVAYRVLNDDGSLRASGYRGFVGGQAQVQVAAPFTGWVEADLYDRAGNRVAQSSSTFTITKGMAVTTAEATATTGGGTEAYYGRWVNGSVEFVLDVAKPLPDDTTVTDYQVNTNGTGWTDAGITFDASSQTARYTVADEGEKPFYFRARTEYNDGVNVVPNEGVPTPLFTTRIDTTPPDPPTVSIAQPEYTLGSGVYNGYITVTLAGTDAVSGVQSLRYSLDDGTSWKSYNGPFNISPQFEGYLKVIAQDRAGNTSETLSPTFKVDRAAPAAPALSATAGGADYYGSTWTAEDVVVTPSDGVPAPEPVGFSGIAYYEYSRDGGVSWTGVTPGNSITVNTNGRVNLRVRAVSNAGIPGDFAVFTVLRDDTSPDITVQEKDASGAGYDGIGWTGGDVFFTLGTTQSYASPFHYEYQKAGDSGWTALPGNTLHVGESEAAKYVFRLMTETKEIESGDYMVKIDKARPGQATAVVNGTMGQNGWYTAVRDIALPSVLLDEDGVQRSGITVQYALYHPGDTPPAYTTGSPALSGDGSYILDVQTQDEAGNLNTADSQTIKLDSTPPEMDAIAFEQAGLPGALGYLFAGSAKVLLTGRDATSGILRYEYQLVPKGDSFDAAAWQTYGLLYVPPGFRGTLYARAVDRAGNVSGDTAATVKKVDITVDIDPPRAPSLSASAGGLPCKEKLWMHDLVVLHFTPQGSPLSGIDHYEVNRGGGWETLPPGVNYIEIWENGKTVVQVRAVSGAGIVGPAAAFEVWRDDQKPDLQVEAKLADGTPYGGGWTNQTVRYILHNTTANPSGILFYDYFDGVDRQVTGTVELFMDTAQAGDKHTFRAKSGTILPYYSDWQDFTAKIDKTPPAAPGIELAAPATGDNGWYTTPTGFFVTEAAQDSGSPVRTEISRDGGLTWNDYSPVPAFPAWDGQYHYAVRAKDEAGNQSGMDSVAFGVDNTPPSEILFSFTRADGSPVAAGPGGEILANQALYATLKGTDALSGMGSITYTLLEEGKPEKTVGPETVDADGCVRFELPIGFTGRVKAKGTDLAGNETREGLAVSPRVVLKNQGAATGEITTPQQPRRLSWYRGNVNLELRVQDEEEGLSRVVIKLNNTVTQEVNYPSPVKEEQVFTQVVSESRQENLVELTAYDSYGNTFVVQKAVNIDNTVPAPPRVSPLLYDPLYIPPVITRPDMPPPIPDENGFVDGKKAYGSEWTNRPVYLELGGDEAIPSGYARYEYSASLDEGASWSAWEVISRLAAKTHEAQGDQNTEYRFRVVSNVEAVSEASAPMRVRIDTVAPPTAQVELAGQPDEGGIYRTALDVTITAPAEESGVHSPVTTYVSVQGETQPMLNTQAGAAGVLTQQELASGEWVKLTLPEGSYTLQVYTKDEAGNASAVQSLPLRVETAQGRGEAEAYNTGPTGGGNAGVQVQRSPQTGDSSGAGVWVWCLALAGLAAAAAAPLAVWRGRKNRRAR